MASPRPDLCIVGRTRFDCDNLAVLAKKLGATARICEGIAEFQSQLATVGSSSLILVEAAAISDAEARSVLSLSGVTPAYAFGRQNKPALAEQLAELGFRDFIAIPADERIFGEILAQVRPADVEVIYHHEDMARLMTLVQRVAKSPVPILLIGETGTGKEVIAREIHRSSDRAHGPFVSINCAAIPDHLLESELFGYEKGAFTGAVGRRVGRFEEASGGTLLLDEIGEMDLRLQAKLLRAIQERAIDRVGGRSAIPVDIRIVATTNRDLAAEVAARRFREDLFYRLNVINIMVPALRDRVSDVAVLAKSFCLKFCEKSGVRPKALTSGALAKLAEYRWPGNVRELENTIYRAVLIANGSTVDAGDIIFTHQQGASLLDRGADHSNFTSSPHVDVPDEGKPMDTGGPDVSGVESIIVAEKAASERPSGSDMADPSPIQTFVGRSIADLEQELIKATLDHCYGNRTRAATILGISIQTLRNKLERYGV
jgi:two-component system, response regulator FlrC